MLNNNLLATVVTLILVLVWLRIIDFFALKGKITSQLSRKIVHAGTGPIFVLCWFLFDSSDSSRYLAALVPLLITIQFAAVGLGIMKDEATVQALSRNGNPREILKGPLFYGIIFVTLTIIYWQDSPIAIVALMLLCGGDGFADILGRRWGKVKLPWSKDKSWIGSLSMFLGGFLFALGIIGIFVNADVFPGTLADYFFPILIISIVGTLVEAIPIKDIDNISITLTALALGHLLF